MLRIVLRYVVHGGIGFRHLKPHKPLYTMSNLWLLSIDGDVKRAFSSRSRAILACSKYVLRYAQDSVRLSEYDALDYSDSCIRAFTTSNHFFALGLEFHLSPVLFED